MRTCGKTDHKLIYSIACNEANYNVFESAQKIGLRIKP
jgi:hypothetical protein